MIMLNLIHPHDGSQTLNTREQRGRAGGGSASFLS